MPQKADPRLTQDIAYIYEILHCNHCIIPNETTICSGFAENDEVVAVEDFIDVGNILGKSWVGLWKVPSSSDTSLGKLLRKTVKLRGQHIA